jgi:hypothetical protein
LKHTAHSSRLPNEDDWVALVARVETMQDIVAALKVSPCCTNEDILHYLDKVTNDLYCLTETYEIVNGTFRNDE